VPQEDGLAAAWRSRVVGFFFGLVIETKRFEDVSFGTSTHASEIPEFGRKMNDMEP